MREPKFFRLPLSFGALNIEIRPLEDDIHILVYGGSRPHLGCTVLTQPRPSLTGDGSISCTSSVLNVPGHKDEVICRYLAEAISVKENAIVVCSGGFHEDNLTPAQLQELTDVLKTFAGQLSLS